MEKSHKRAKTKKVDNEEKNASGKQSRDEQNQSSNCD
jgi:hypothetical protein